MTDLLYLYRLAEQDRIRVDCFDLRSREALSIMDPDGCCYIAIDPFQLRRESDERQKLAHELGHCETGSFYNRYAACDVRQKHENRADKWAIKKLVPKDELEAAVNAGHTEFWDLAELFSVTEDFMKKAVCWYRHGNLNVEALFPAAPCPS